MQLMSDGSMIRRLSRVTRHGGRVSYLSIGKIIPALLQSAEEPCAPDFDSSDVGPELLRPE